MSDVQEPVRSRTFTWQDPHKTAQTGMTLSGFDYLSAMVSGAVPPPPIAETLGFSAPAEVERGKVTVFFEPQEFHYNPIGSVHGGVISTLLDTASACAVHSLLPLGTGYTTLELKVNFARAVQANTGPMRSIGTVIYLGRRTAIAEARLLDASDRLYAHCTQTCLIFEPAGKTR